MDLHRLAVDILTPALVVFTLTVGYFAGLRPLLRQTPGFRDLYDAEASFWGAVDTKFGGIKQKLTTLLISLAGFLVIAHDSINGLLQQAGLDPSTLGTQILPSVPTYVWPLLTMAVLWLVQRFRNAADVQARANAEALLQAGQPLAAPAPGLPVNTLPSPPPQAG